MKPKHVKPLKIATELFKFEHLCIGNARTVEFPEGGRKKKDISKNCPVEVLRGY